MIYPINNKFDFWRNMKKITTLIIAFSMFGSLYADDHKKEKREHPNKLMSAKECMETKAGIKWFLGAADNVFEDIKKYGDSKDKSWNDKKWADAIAMSSLAANYSEVYDVWCKDMINHRMKMRMHDSYRDHTQKKTKKKD